PRPRAHRVPARPPGGGPRCDRRRRGRTGLLPLVPDGQLRVGVRLRETVRGGRRRGPAPSRSLVSCVRGEGGGRGARGGAAPRRLSAYAAGLGLGLIG